MGCVHLNKEMKFSCKRCGNCCRVPGTVRVNEREIEAIAESLNVSVDQLVNERLTLMPDRRGLSLDQDEQGACVFLDPDQGCLIEAVKPRQCKEFPWRWQYENVEEICKGIKIER
jgi:Fe-S-cluster containining protein